MVLRTVFHTRTGTVALTDAMALGPGERGHRIGHGSQHVIVRRVEGIDGDVDMMLDLALRPEYGLTVPVLMHEPGGLRSRGGPRSDFLVSPVATEILVDHARAAFRVHAGDTVDFSLAVGSPWPEGTPAPNVARPGDLLDSTIEGWRSWSRLHQSYDGPYARARAPQRPGPAGDDVRAHRRGGRRPHDVAPRVDRRHPQLGLPVLLGA